jgi:2-keto-4-pentenoate hydratase/2-oxohepta-3-ene-1,7-dioic acid hydratase in catechol pathway
MKFITFALSSDPNKTPRTGVWKEDGSAVDLQASYLAANGVLSDDFTDMVKLIEGGAKTRKLVEDLLQDKHAVSFAKDEFGLLSPILRPVSYKDTMCHEKHLIQAVRTFYKMQGKDVDSMDLKPDKHWYEAPIYYKGNCNSFVGDGAVVGYPKGETFRDIELELAVIIGKEGHDLSPEEAWDHIFGYTILNDFSARITQSKDMASSSHLGPAHGKDFASGMGPCITTADEFNVDDAVMCWRVNGEEWGRGNANEMYHKVNTVVSYSSFAEIIYPGSLIGTGTVGNGCALEFGKSLNPGDVVELEIEGIGVLTNTIAE